MADDFTHDPRTGRYRNLRTGRFVAELNIRDVIDQMVQDGALRINPVSEGLLTGDVTLAEWQTEVMLAIRESHVAAGMAAHGGAAAMTPADWGFIGQKVKAQYEFLRDFANGIADGSIPLDGRIAPRARMYAASSRVMFQSMRARDDAERGYTEESNVLHASESCPSCQAQTALGWVESGTLIPIGSRTCLSNCKCTIVRRAGAAKSTLNRSEWPPLRLVG